MKKYSSLLRQMYEGRFRNLLYGIYNAIDSDGFVKEISAVDKQDYGMDDFHFFNFVLHEDTRNAIKGNDNDSVSLQMLKGFKYYVEHELQDGISAHCRIYILKDYGTMVAVKPKNFSLDNLKKE